MADIATLGWDVRWAEALATLGDPSLQPARVVEDYGRAWVVSSGQAEYNAEISGRFHFKTASRAGYPAVGDWVAVNVTGAGGSALVHAVLPRRSSFFRKAAGDRTEEQVVAANADTVFIVTGLDGNFNARRVERYLTMAWESGARPTVVLTKTDLSNDLVGQVREIEAVALGTPVHAVSVVTGYGLDALQAYLRPGQTVALLGSSGAGKSTLINSLLGGSVQRVQEVRADDSRGRHTTTHRQLFVLPSGAMVIDTPGMRELGLWDADEGLRSTFGDIESLAYGCRFRDCRHQNEPGCAVREAVDAGRLPAARLASFYKLRGELAYLESKTDKDLGLERKRREQELSRLIKDLKPRH